MEILEFLRDVLSQPALLIGLMSFIGLVALGRPAHKIMTGTLKPILGYLMLSAGAGVIVANLDPLGKMIETGFHITGVVPNNEAVTSVAQKMLGVETMSILVAGLFFNLAIARFTKYKYVFLTGHHSFFMACLLSAVLGASGFSGTQLVLIGGFILGAWSSISPAIGQHYTMKVTEGDEIAMGHFGSLGYYISAWAGKFAGNPADSTEKIEIPEKWGFLRDTTVSTALTMMVIYLIAAIAAGPAYVATLSGSMSPFLFALMDALPIIRPYNHFAGTAGRGAINLNKDGKSLSVVNLMGHYGLPHTNNAFLEAERALKECESENILIDFHAEATSEKNAFFRLFCGRVGAIAGTHTHVGTDDLQIVSGTAYVSDVGLSGAFDGVIGMDAEAPVKSFLTGLKHSFKVNEKCRRIFQMVVFEFDGGRCTDAFKIRVIDGVGEPLVQRAVKFA